MTNRTIEIEREAWDQLCKLVLGADAKAAVMGPRGTYDVEQRIMFIRGSVFPHITGLVKYIEAERRRALVGGSRE